MKNLALFGGEKSRKKPFPRHPILDSKEKDAILDVINSGNLSTFIASNGENFLGGKKIKEFENNFAEFIGTKYAIAFNSATSALHAANISVGVKPGDEVLVPPYTFTSTATSVLMNNAIPIFSDVKEDIFCLDPKKLEKNTSALTKAVIPVHLFGHPADMDEIMEFAIKYDLKVIEDCAQAPGSQYKGKNVGTIGDCGIFSFQETKNMTTGEGGMLVTNDEHIATAARMVRNHGEVLLDSASERTYTSEILGWGYRMTEIEAAIGIIQLSKLPKMNEERIRLSNHLSKKISSIEGLKHVKYDFVKHTYYVYAFSYNEEKIGIPREKFCEAVRAEGIPVYGGYVKPLYLNPLYQEKRSFSFKHYQGNVSYNKGICPVTEKLHEHSLIVTTICRPPASIDDMDDFSIAIEKVLENKQELKK